MGGKRKGKSKPSLLPKDTVCLVEVSSDPKLNDVAEPRKLRAPEMKETIAQPQIEEVSLPETPVSVYVSCLVPMPTTQEQSPMQTPLLCRRSTKEIEQFHKSRKKLTQLLQKNKKKTKAVTQALKRSKVMSDISKIYLAMSKAKAGSKPFTVKQLF